MEDVPPTAQVILGVSLQRSGQGLTHGVELDVPGFGSTDEVNDLHSVAVAGKLRQVVRISGLDPTL